MNVSRYAAANQFVSNENTEYLLIELLKRIPSGPLRKFAFDTLEDSMAVYAKSAKQTRDMWAEVRRLNREFIAERVKIILDMSYEHDSQEDYAMSMFTADSLLFASDDPNRTTGREYDVSDDLKNFGISERTMRYQKIPFWQNLSRGRNQQRDIDETVSNANNGSTLEMPTHVRGWDISKMLKNRNL